MTHAASTAALRAGATLRGVLELGRELGRHIPVVLMCCSNRILGRGVERFADLLARPARVG